MSLRKRGQFPTKRKLAFVIADDDDEGPRRLSMVLADLGRKLNAALSSLNRAPVVDEKVS